MENLSLEVAYGRYGAQIANKQRSLSALAADGSLVLTCKSEQFSRPGAGILRYSAQLSTVDRHVVTGRGTRHASADCA